MSIKSEKDWLYRESTKEATKERATVAWAAGGERKSGFYAEENDPSDPRSAYAGANGKNRNLGEQF